MWNEEYQSKSVYIFCTFCIFTYVTNGCSFVQTQSGCDCEEVSHVWRHQYNIITGFLVPSLYSHQCRINQTYLKKGVITSWHEITWQLNVVVETERRKKIWRTVWHFLLQSTWEHRMWIYYSLRPEIFNGVKFRDESQVGLPCFALVIFKEPQRPSVK